MHCVFCLQCEDGILPRGRIVQKLYLHVRGNQVPDIVDGLFRFWVQMNMTCASCGQDNEQKKSRVRSALFA